MTNRPYILVYFRIPYSSTFWYREAICFDLKVIPFVGGWLNQPIWKKYVEVKLDRFSK